MFLPYFILFVCLQLVCCAIKCDKETNECDAQERRYLIYGVNFGEGFNLRRDVYLRIAKRQNFILVLPPWFTPHWKQNDWHNPKQWSEFFDLESMNRFVPVMEFADFLKESGDQVESTLYLQHYSEGWTSVEYELKYDLRPCMEADRYFEQLDNGDFKSIARSLRGATFKRLRCLSIQGESRTLVKAILELEQSTKSMYVDRVETVLHDNFGDKFYWEARRSMRYANNLIAIGDKFRQEVLNSINNVDKTELKPKWEDQKPKVGSAVGGDYLCVHWRRRDFSTYAHKNDVPSIKGTVDQIERLLSSLNLNTVFVSTDAEDQEYRELNEQLSTLGIQVARFINSTLSEGAVSIVDQWICSHSRYFIGTHVSTFSYRIHEDREILGFDPLKTFNRLCPDNEADCEQPAKWTILYE
ncbi:GDP-fucose protein O-fucosyltransferase 2 precursor [Aphelenchoides bicaudatus]|nr:GDP-fucose protein O-fucosyltransferase 2 precursor [Aphelenchoides bicaudatus]